MTTLDEMCERHVKMNRLQRLERLVELEKRFAELAAKQESWTDQDWPDYDERAALNDLVVREWLEEYWKEQDRELAYQLIEILCPLMTEYHKARGW